jgi:hypothetical protein
MTFVGFLVAAITMATGATDPLPMAEHGVGLSVPQVCRPDGKGPQTRLFGGDDFSNDPSGRAKRAMASAFESMLSGMIAGLGAEDGDTAYLCTMISHAQGAIALARVQIQLGRDQAAVDLARRFIDLKLDEITVLTRQLKQARI